LAAAPNIPEMGDGAVISTLPLKRKFVEEVESKTSSPPNKLSPTSTSFPPLPSKVKKSAPFNVQLWPRFLLIQSSSPTKLTDYSPFKFFDGIEFIVPNYAQLSPLSSGDFLIEVKTKEESDKLLETTSLSDIKIPVKITPYKSLNTCKGLIKCPTLNPCSDEEIISRLRSQGVCGVKRLIIRKNNKEIKTSTYILDFAVPEPPIDLRIAYVFARVIPFYPNPLRCYNCQLFGHHKSKCKRVAVCGKCAKPAHEGDCDNPPACVNCEIHQLKSDHPSYSKDCERWSFEKEVVSTRYKYKLTFPEARKVVTSRYLSGNPAKSTATVVKSGITKIGRTIATQYCNSDFETPKATEPKPNSKTQQKNTPPTSPKKNAKPASPKKSPSKPKEPKQTKISFSQPSSSSSNNSTSPASQYDWQTAGKKGAKAQNKNKPRTGKDPKSARDAIISKNRYGVLGDMNDMEIEILSSHGSPQKSPGRPPASQRVDQAHGPDWWKYKETGYPPESDASPRPDPVENMDSDPPDTENKNTGKNTKQNNGVTDPVKIDRKK
jgi:hypothetical protein